jgi:arginine decarboxylase
MKNKTVYELKTLEKNSGNIVIGCRIPKDYFVTKGRGESNITIHAGSYHLALKDAGIEICNIMQYSSILPGIAQQIEKPEKFVHGQVMETIMAVCNSKNGQLCTAGIISGWLHNKRTGERYGGLVCEHYGQITRNEVEKRLAASIEELYANGFSEEYELKDINIFIESFRPKKKHGTALVAMCFTNYVVPLVE